MRVLILGRFAKAVGILRRLQRRGQLRGLAYSSFFSAIWRF